MLNDPVLFGVLQCTVENGSSYGILQSVVSTKCIGIMQSSNCAFGQTHFFAVGEGRFLIQLTTQFKEE